MQTKRRQSMRWRLSWFILSVIATSCALTTIVYLLVWIFFRNNPILIFITLNPFFLCMVLFIVCIVIVTILSTFLGKFHLRPMKAIADATKQVKRGDFKVQVDPTLAAPASELGELIVSFNEMVRELDSIEFFRTDFINNFSHEFKTPIVSIRGFARELQYGDLDEARRLEYAKIIAEEADRLAKLSTNILELSKIENQQIVTNKRDFYLDEQLRQCILLQEPAWTAKGIDIIPDLEEVQYHSDEELLSHIWINLIGNAIKFTPEGGSVYVSLNRLEGGVKVVIRDTGIGMSEDVQQRIFEKFYQGDNSHHRSGYGIGLAMAHRVVTLCGGRIEVESKPGEGSTFVVFLP